MRLSLSFHSVVALVTVGSTLMSAIEAGRSGAKSAFRSSPQPVDRQEHRVGDLPWDQGEEAIEESYAGHIPIRTWREGTDHGDTSIFYWFFPALAPKVKDPPLIIWFQGGPGSSSMIGLFFENGPVRITKDMTLKRNPWTWANDYSMLFIDQPVGTGYSFVTRTSDDQDDDGNVHRTMYNNITEFNNRHRNHNSYDKKNSAIKTRASILSELEKHLLDAQDRESIIFSDNAHLSFNEKLVRSQVEAGPLFNNGYVRDQRGVVVDLLEFLDQFYERYPEQRDRDLYLSGESYAGKYIPSLAHGILDHNDQVREKQTADDGSSSLIPLKGIAMGNSLTDPLTQIQVHADHAYYIGLINANRANQMRDLQFQSVNAAKQGKFVESNHFRLAMFAVFQNATGGLNWYDIRKGQVPNDWGFMDKFMNLDQVKDSLNIYGPRLSYLKSIDAEQEEIDFVLAGRNLTVFEKDPLVIHTLAGDIMKSVAYLVPDLLKAGLKVLCYQGIYDFRDAVAGSSIWINNLDWPGQSQFSNKDRDVWIVDNVLAGYVTEYENLRAMVVLGAGHLAPMDQGKTTLRMIQSLIDDTELETYHPKPLGDATSVEQSKHTM